MVVATSPDVLAEVIAAAVARRVDMTLAENRIASVAEVHATLPAIAPDLPCALIVVGCRGDTEQYVEQWLDERPNLVVLRLDIIGDIVEFALDDIGLEPLLAALTELVGHAAGPQRQRILHLQMSQAAPPDAPGPVLRHGPPAASALPDAVASWIRVLLRHAIGQLSDGNGDLPGLTVTAATAAQLLDGDAGSAAMAGAPEVEAADLALRQALAAADARAEPIAAARQALDLTDIEWRVLLLALAPELDARYQRCIGVLLDDMGRRAGTLGLWAPLLGGPTTVRCALARAGNLGRWRLLEGRCGELPAADEPLRLDPPLADWLLGNDGALDADLRVRRVARTAPWPGATLLDGQQERIQAAGLMARLQQPGAPHWLLLGGEDGAGWRALCELGAAQLPAVPVRVEVARLGGLDPLEAEECALRVGRLARLTGRPLLVDATGVEDAHAGEQAAHSFIAALAATGCRAALVCQDETQVAAMLGAMPFELGDAALLPSLRAGAARAAAAGAQVAIGADTGQAIASLYPLSVDGLERAMRLACARPLPGNAADPCHDRFAAACKQVAAEGVSHLAERIEPAFSLDSVVLPADRKQQLTEIVDSIRLGPKVLDDWQFRAHLPYGRGVTVLFHGPSGTGKTMAALGIAHRLDIQVLRLDFARVVSKYIGDTERNIDRVFSDAQKSGCAILIDEADALLGKRSEVKDAHDRYANIEVAYLLQRMESYDGLAILTTNLRQNLDAAFLRRLRFIVEFPRPDASAREEIWRRCLPGHCHALDTATFRLLGRKVELTGGHIRQITLRAAFLAAAADRPIGLDHIRYATNAELAKLGMPAMELDGQEGRRAA